MPVSGARGASTHQRIKKQASKRDPKPIPTASPTEIVPVSANSQAFPTVYSKGFFRYQRQVRYIYTRHAVEISVAALIITNFIINIIEKQIDPDTKPYGEKKYEMTWDSFTMFFNIVFLIELLFNMYGFWLYEFWNSGWNVFDFVVVSIGVLDFGDMSLGPLEYLRMLRAFRVFRIFKRVESLRKIMESLGRAIPGVMNAFLILLIVMSIYAILAVEMFKYETHMITGRNDAFGKEYFGNFFKALYTLFQILTGDSWSEAIARPLMEGVYEKSDGSWNIRGSCCAIYFVSFQLLCSVVLINVVVAVLLEKMVDNEEENEISADEHEDILNLPEVPYDLLDREKLPPPQCDDKVLKKVDDKIAEVRDNMLSFIQDEITHDDSLDFSNSKINNKLKESTDEQNTTYEKNGVHRQPIHDTVKSCLDFSNFKNDTLKENVDKQNTIREKIEVKMQPIHDLVKSIKDDLVREVRDTQQSTVQSHDELRRELKELRELMSSVLEHKKMQP